MASPANASVPAEPRDIVAELTDPEEASREVVRRFRTIDRERFGKRERWIAEMRSERREFERRLAKAAAEAARKERGRCDPGWTD